jgi:AbrB family looped-hinge helix DNA binding protein
MKFSFSKRFSSTVSSKGQTVVPKEVREKFDIHEGTKLTWIVKDGQLRVLRIPDDPVEALRGVLKGHGTYEEWLAERNAERERERLKDEEELERWRATSSIPRRS